MWEIISAEQIRFSTSATGVVCEKEKCLKLMAEQNNGENKGLLGEENKAYVCQLIVNISKYCCKPAHIIHFVYKSRKIQPIKSGKSILLTCSSDISNAVL